MRKPVLLAVIALAGCGGSSDTGQATRAAAAATPARVAQAAPSPPPRLTNRRPCATAPGFTCATLRVPLERGASGPAGGTLRLAVAVEDVRRAPRGVLVMLTGGPGQPGVPFADGARERLGAAASAGYRFVLLDQRGTGATALRCPALQAAMGTSDLTVPPPSAVTACARRLGARRTAFTTADTVADLDDLRRALGEDRIGLVGTSYGTFVAERYAIAHPDHTARLLLDSVVPHAGVDAAGTEPLRATGRVLRRLCAQRRCRSNPVADLAAVVRRDGNGPQVYDTLTALSVGAPSYPGVIPALAAARRGHRAPLRRLIRAVRGAQQAPAGVLSQGLHEATLCAESRFPWRVDAPVATRAAAVARVRTRLRPADTYPFDAATATGNGFVASCLPWPAVARPAPVPAGLPPVPALLLGGGRDLSTPLEWTREEAAHAPRGKLVVDPTSGHGVLRGARGAVRRAVVAFMQG